MPAQYSEEGDSTSLSFASVAKHDKYGITRSRSSSSSSASSISSTTSITSLFESSLSLLGSLPVATSTSDPSKPIIQSTLKHGKLKLHMSQVDKYEEIELQSHLLWPSSQKMIDMMERETLGYDVQGERVLELGAGSALVSLVACKMGASHVCITDYPSTRIIDAIRKNVNSNLSDEERRRVAIIPLDWTDEEALKGMSLKYPDGFTRILAADTLWMGHLNISQLRVMTTLLSRSSTSRIIILAGLHTGRHVIRTFLDTCVEVGLEIERAEEIDRRNEVEEKGIDWKKVVEEKWDAESIVEGIEEERRRWLVWIVLRWPEDIRAYETRVGRV